MSTCVSKWLCVFWFVLFLESWAQLWQWGLPVGFILHNRTLCLPLSGNYLPFTSSFRHTLCWVPKLNPTRPGETRLGRMPLIQSGLVHSFCNPLSRFSHLPHCLIQRVVSLIALFTVLKSSPAPSQLTQLCYALPPCHTHIHTQINTITIVPVSCLCCHYAAAEWDTIFHWSKTTHTHTHMCIRMFISTQYNSH